MKRSHTVDVSPSLTSPQKSDRIQWALYHRPPPHKKAIALIKQNAIAFPYFPKAIAYSGRFTIAHLPTNKRSFFRKEKAIAFVQSLLSAIALNLRSSPAIAQRARGHRKHRTDN